MVRNRKQNWQEKDERVREKEKRRRRNEKADIKYLLCN